MQHAVRGKGQAWALLGVGWDRSDKRVGPGNEAGI